MVIVAVAVAYLVLTRLPLEGTWTGFIPAILFAVIPLVALSWAARGRWRAIFRRVRFADVGVMAGFWLLNLAVTLISGAIISRTARTTSNAAAENIVDMSAGERILFFIRAAIQLLGEELLTILPFLALIYWLHTRTSRRTAVIVAWLVTSVAFGALHLPTYDWNVVQAVVGIGLARIVLTAAYIRTKNLWVSTGAHILNDWSFLLLALKG